MLHALASVMDRSDPPDPLSREVDNLLGQLKSQPFGRPAVKVGCANRDRRSRPALMVGAARDSTEHAWGKTLLVLTLGTALPFWPYAHGCGPGLISYFAALGVLLATATWALFAAWRQQAAPAYAVGLALLLWGFGLGLTQVLPRTGYAEARAYWGCQAGMEPEPGSAPLPGKVPESPVPVSDGLGNLPPFF
jgi:hypothetical protein